MAIDQSKVSEYSRKLLLSKMRVLASHSFYGLLLSHLKFALDEACPTAYTDGKKIAFNPSFLESLTEDETDFVLMHEVLHVVLKHCTRGNDYSPEGFNIACDIVVNSNILKSMDDDLRKISIGKEVLMHLAPNNKEGHLYTAEEVYDMLPSSQKSSSGASFGNGNKEGNGAGNKSSSNNNGNNNKNGSGSNTGTDSSSNSSAKSKPGASAGASTISGTSKGSDSKGSSSNGLGGNGSFDNKGGASKYRVFDDHSFWSEESDEQYEDEWDKYFEDACKIVSIEDPSNKRGTLPAFAERILSERKKAQTNWREVLDNFVQEDINDYSFNPPDRRFSDYDFMLPDLNEKEDSVKNVLFMIDTSGSMSNKMITQAFDEIRGAIEQFNGKLEGHLGFFDAVVVEPKPFSSIEELEIIRPYGGGGTKFDIIFKYVKEKMNDPFPSSIVILTDGYAPFPKEEDAMDVPVLWIINNDEVVPPWGKHATIKVE